jgi:hypothetical protein
LVRGNWHSSFSTRARWKTNQTRESRLCSIRDYPKKTEVKALAAEFLGRVRKAPSVQAGSTVQQLVTGTFFPDVEKRLTKGTVTLYRNMWKLLQPHLRHLRLPDVRVVDVQNALNGIYNTRGDALCHDIFMQTKGSGKRHLCPRVSPWSPSFP